MWWLFWRCGGTLEMWWPHLGPKKKKKKNWGATPNTDTTSLVNFLPLLQYMDAKMPKSYIADDDANAQLWFKETIHLFYFFNCNLQDFANNKNIVLQYSRSIGTFNVVFSPARHVGSGSWKPFGQEALRRPSAQLQSAHQVTLHNWQLLGYLDDSF